MTIGDVAIKMLAIGKSRITRLADRLWTERQTAGGNATRQRRGGAENRKNGVAMKKQRTCVRGRVTITMNDQQHDELQKASEELGIYPSEYILRCIRLERLIAAADGAVHVVSSDGAVERIRFV